MSWRGGTARTRIGAPKGPFLQGLNENKSDYFFAHRYLIFYSPFDIGYKFFKFLPIKIICSALKEVYRYR
jgi:hypothetical protein